MAPTHSGFVALIGPTNAGKSTLVNRLVGAKVSIVSHKVQTTRAIVRGIAIHDNAQIVFMDTPGIFKPRRRLDRAMVTTAWGGAKDADFIMLLIDSERGIRGDAEAMSRRAEGSCPAEDPCSEQDRPRSPRRSAGARRRGQREDCLRPDLHDLGRKRFGLRRCHGLSGKDAAGRPVVLSRGPDFRPADAPARRGNHPRKAVLRLHQELPYSSHVETEKWEERKDGSVRIEQVIYVERESQKKIALGKAGETIKAISTASRKELSEILEQPVHLFLFVKVRENWGDDPERFREMGLEFPR